MVKLNEGCQVFLDTIYQKGVNINDHKVDPMVIKDNLLKLEGLV
jgi:hypothetical protein